MPRLPLPFFPLRRVVHGNVALIKWYQEFSVAEMLLYCGNSTRSPTFTPLFSKKPWFTSRAYWAGSAET
jgi:hypothetical protein